MKLPFWDRVSENGKQALAIVAVLQALHFMIAVPLGAYDNWRMSERWGAELWMMRDHAAVLSVVETVSLNRTVGLGGFREECLSYVENAFIFSAFDETNCAELQSFDEILHDALTVFEVASDLAPSFGTAWN